MSKLASSRTITLLLIILAAAASRLIPHPPNVTSVAALALFSGAKLDDRRMAFVLPVAALLLSDMVLGFYPHMEIVYGAFLVSVGLGGLLRQKAGIARIAATTLASSICFFLITNFGVWAVGGLYAYTLSGLETCFVAAIPFFRNTMLGDLFYAGILFGGFALLERRNPAWNRPLPAAAPQ